MFQSLPVYEGHGYRIVKTSVLYRWFFGYRYLLFHDDSKSCPIFGGYSISQCMLYLAEDALIRCMSTEQYIEYITDILGFHPYLNDI